MNYYVAMRFDPEACMLLDLKVLKDLIKLMAWCDIIDTVRYRWVSCPGGPDPVNPEHMTPVSYSYNPHDGVEGTWEIFEAQGEVSPNDIII